MSSTNSANKKDPLLLRVGAKVFRRLSRDQTAPIVLDEIHILNSDEQRQLKGVERSAIWRGALIGTFSAIICGFSWFAAVWTLGPVPADAGISDQWRHYLIMGGLVSVATIIEIVLLYWNALHSVHRMAHAAGLNLFSEDDQPEAVLNALVSAALELPHSREETLFATPGREVARSWIILVTLMYRLKVTFTYYIAKALVQRFLGRVVVRWAIELIAIPVYAFWDALVTYWVLRQARVCAMGPSCVKHLSLEIQNRNPSIDDKVRLSMLCAVGSTVARNSHLHPNVELLLRELVSVYGSPSQMEIDDSSNLLELLRELDSDGQELVIQVLSLSLIIDGRASLWERRLLQSCLESCGLEKNLKPLRRGLKQFRHGQSIDLWSLVPIAMKGDNTK